MRAARQVVGERGGRLVSRGFRPKEEGARWSVVVAAAMHNKCTSTRLDAYLAPLPSAGLDAVSATAMTDIGAELSSELTRIIDCPYPASLSVSIQRLLDAAPCTPAKHMTPMHLQPMNADARATAESGRPPCSRQWTYNPCLHPQPPALCGGKAGDTGL